jgi:hypothetical protein
MNETMEKREAKRAHKGLKGVITGCVAMSFLHSVQDDV